MPTNPTATNPHFPTEDEITEARKSLDDVSIVDRYKTEMEERLRQIEVEIPHHERAKATAAERARELKAEREEIQRALKAMVKRTRSK